MVITVIPTEFSTTKLRRKLATDGLTETVRAAGDLLTRKHLGRPVFDPLTEHDIVHTIQQKELRRNGQIVQAPPVEESTPFTALLSGGIVLTETGLSLTGSFEIVEESAAEPDHAKQATMEMLSRELFYGTLPLGRLFCNSWGDLEITSSVDGPIAPLISRYPNYYHWMVETVPKIRYIREFENQTGTDVRILVRSRAPPFVDETIDLLDWPESKVVRSTEPIYEVQNLVVPSFPERSPADFNWMRGELLDAVSTDELATETNDGHNVYVSRESAVERRVLNEAEVMDVLSDYGFKRYRLENRTLAQNIRLFNQADVIVGPHGAGLTDIIFAEDCTLLELFGNKIKDPYEQLANTLSVNYEPMYCQADSADIVVDTEKLESRVSELVSADRT